jgi:hypothetical protein
MKRSDFHRWAVVGAQQRLVEIANEQKAIFAAFPELRAGGALSANDGEPQTARRRGGRRKMSAAARKRISDAQKARWAKQRANKS